MSFDAKRLYELLPAIYRIRDNTEPGEPLKALISVIAEQVAVIEENLEQLYDDQFIETCAEWVVPYIGDLVGARGVFVFPGGDLSQRAQVANTIAYRRRKGTAAVLEQLARDVTGWNASVVEYFELLATTQYMNHLRPHNVSMSSVRSSLQVERVNTPFDKLPRTADVRRIEPRRGLYNIPNIGVFLWRLGNYPVTAGPCFKLDNRRYTFDALGKDIQLYNRPVTEKEITHLAEPINVPMPLGRLTMSRDIDTYYGLSKSALVYVDGAPILNVSICDLRDDGSAFGWAHEPQTRIAIDPVLGRIAFPMGWIPSTVHASYQYGFSADMGGGEYGRGSSFTGELEPVLQIPMPSLTTIQDAVNALASTGGTVEIQKEKTNRYYVEAPVISVAAEKHIELRGADEHRPVIMLNGDMLVIGSESSEVTLNGLLISGRIVVPDVVSAGSANQLRFLRLRHCTLVGDLSVEAEDVVVEIDRSIVGGITIAGTSEARITSSIVDSGSETNVAYEGGPLTLVNSTVIGTVRTRIMTLASNSIFFARTVEAERLQEGCVRFCYVPPGSRLPRLFECQPADPNEAERLRPIFTSLRYGDAGYCQLSSHCAIEIREGADDRAEMGAFHDLYQPQRIGNLRARLDEYLRVGLEAGILSAS